jgi:hypothetical protein
MARVISADVSTIEVALADSGNALYGRTGHVDHSV